MKTLLLSPHLDDACLSASQFLAAQPNCDIVTVFAGAPDEPVMTDYDAKCGFVSALDAIGSRRHEDQDAMARLQQTPIHWDYLDHQYRDTDGLPNFDQLVQQIVDTAVGYDMVISCLGLLHPDHILLGNAVIAAAPAIEADVYLWEDLPHRVLHPEAVVDRLAGIDATLEHPGIIGPVADKIRALVCYRSQMGTGDLDFNYLCVPERFWKINKEGSQQYAKGN